jgi:hypothetical protein
MQQDHYPRSRVGLLAMVYVELTTTRQAALRFEPIAAAPSNAPVAANVRPQPLPARVSKADRAAHRPFDGYSSAAATPA